MNTTKTTKTPIIKSPKIKSREYSLYCKIYSNFQGWSTNLCAKRMTIDNWMLIYILSRLGCNQKGNIQ